jgi:hypothetical protein
MLSRPWFASDRMFTFVVLQFVAMVSLYVAAARQNDGEARTKALRRLELSAAVTVVVWTLIVVTRGIVVGLALSAGAAVGVSLLVAVDFVARRAKARIRQRRRPKAKMRQQRRVESKPVDPEVRSAD